MNKRILLKILSPRQNFVAATCRTKSNWFNFVRHVAATKFCRGDKILINQASNVEAFTPGDLSLQPIAAMSACDLAFDCTHKAICCSNVLQRFVASCAPALRFISMEKLSKFLKGYLPSTGGGFSTFTSSFGAGRGVSLK